MLQNIRKNLVYVLPVVVVIMLIGLVLSRVYQPTGGGIPEPDIRIDASEAYQHIGRAAEVCGNVANAVFRQEIGGEPTFINLTNPHPNQELTVVIWGNNRNKWPVPPEEYYTNQRICVVGVIEDHRGTPQIEVREPEQITIR